MESLPLDFRFALRQMRRSPGFAFTAVLILSLGIAANVVVFGVLQALVLRPLDVPDADRVMSLERDRDSTNFSFPEIRDIQNGNLVFSAVAADRLMPVGLEAGGTTRPVWGYEVSGQYFEVVAIKPFVGRLLQRADDEHAGSGDVAVLSWSAWKNYFGSDPQIVGTSIHIDKHPYTVVGVAPRGFYGTEKFVQPDVFVPMAGEAQLEHFDWLDSRHNHNVWAIARIREGIALPQVQADLKTVAANIRKQFPKDEEEDLAIRAVRPGLLGDALGAPARGFLFGIMVLAGIVLLAACANLGSLFAARTADRARELAIRMAIGLSRWRIFRQVLIEACAIAAIAGLAAVALAWTGLSGLAAWHPQISFPMQFAVLPQPSLIAVSSAVSLVSALIFGLVPLRQILRADASEVIKSNSTMSSGRRWALRDFLLAIEIALCCVTVTAAFVALRGLSRALKTELGFNPVNVVRTQFELAQAGYSASDAASFQHRLLTSVSQLPGVEAAAYSNTTPLSIDQSGAAVFRDNTPDLKPNHAFGASYYDVSPGYLAAAGTKLLAGRDFSDVDKAASPAVAIVNQNCVERLFGPASPRDAVGRYFKNISGLRIQIVGVMEDGKYSTLSEDQNAAILFPITQAGDTTTTLLMRTRPDATGDAAQALTKAIGRTIHDLDPAVPIEESGPWTRQLTLPLLPAQIATIALSLLGAFAVLLSIAGMFGLASYTVSKRLRELGIRIALGAQARQILSAALGRMLVLLASGSVAGLVLGIAASRLLAAIVYQASAQDPIVLISVALTMLSTGMLSVAGPVRRALHVEPAVLLREQ